MSTKRKRPGVKTIAAEPETAQTISPKEMGVGIHAIVLELRKITALLERALQPPRRQTLDELDPPHRVGPSTEPGGVEEFISGQWHRRAGDVYAKVAEPGSPNAGDTFGSKHDE